MTGDPLIDPESAARVGTVAATATGEVNRRDWQRWAAAVGDHNPLWFDTDYARANGYRDVVCPPLYLQYAILGVTPLSGLRPDGSSGAVSGGLAFPRAPKRMAGGESTTFHLPAYHRDEIEMVRTISSMPKPSSSLMSELTRSSGATIWMMSEVMSTSTTEAR